jgi:hypothetical protein
MNEYYKRQTEMDFLENELRTMRGCQSFFTLILAIVVLVTLLVIFL